MAHTYYYFDLILFPPFMQKFIRNFVQSTDFKMQEDTLSNMLKKITWSVKKVFGQ